MTIVATEDRVAGGLPRTATAPVRVAVQLARIEAIRMVRHPAVLVGVALTAFMLTMGMAAPDQVFANTFTTPNLTYSIVATGWALIPVGAGTFLAANLAATRSRRRGTDELFDATATTPEQRVDSLIFALAGPALLASAIIAVAMIPIVLAGGVPVAFQGGIVRRVPTLVELVQGPAAVVVCGALGISVGRWLPFVVAAPLLLPGFMASLIGVSWNLDGPGWRLLPFANHLRVLEWIDISGGGPDTPSSYGVMADIALVPVFAHTVYVLAAAAVLWAVARSRRRRDPRMLATGLIALAIAVASAFLFVP